MAWGRTAGPAQQTAGARCTRSIARGRSSRKFCSRLRCGQAVGFCVTEENLSSGRCLATHAANRTGRSTPPRHRGAARAAVRQQCSASRGEAQTAELLLCSRLYHRRRRATSSKKHPCRFSERMDTQSPAAARNRRAGRPSPPPAQPSATALPYNIRSSDPLAYHQLRHGRGACFLLVPLPPSGAMGSPPLRRRHPPPAAVGVNTSDPYSSARLPISAGLQLFRSPQVSRFHSPAGSHRFRQPPSPGASEAEGRGTRLPPHPGPARKTLRETLPPICEWVAAWAPASRPAARAARAGPPRGGPLLSTAHALLLSRAARSRRASI